MFENDFSTIRELVEERAQQILEVIHENIGKLEYKLDVSVQNLSSNS